MENTGSVVSGFLSGHNCMRHLEKVGNSHWAEKEGREEEIRSWAGQNLAISILTHPSRLGTDKNRLNHPQDDCRQSKPDKLVLNQKRNILDLPNSEVGRKIFLAIFPPSSFSLLWLEMSRCHFCYSCLAKILLCDHFCLFRKSHRILASTASPQTTYFCLLSIYCNVGKMM